MKNPLFEQSHPFTKFLFLLFIIVVSFSIFLILGLITAVPLFGLQLSSFQEALNIHNPENMGLVKYMQFVQHLSIFVVPPIIAAYIFSKYPKHYLYAEVKSNFVVYILAAIIIIFAVPLINYTGALNAKLSLPASFSGLETKIRAMEEAAEKMTEAFLNVKTIGGLGVNLIIVALLPAVGEEFLFRGILFRLFVEWSKNKHVAILISAFLFSAIHFQFYGFLPRFLLGVLFGYLLVWSKNIWVPVTVHFVNNGLAVVLYYFMHGSEMYKKAENLGTDSFTMPSVIFSLLLVGMFLYLFYKLTKNEEFVIDS